MNRKTINNTIEKIKGRLHSIDREGMDKLNDFLENQSDYYTAPASTKFHNNFESGLALHSDNVVEQMLDMNNKFNLGLNEETIYLTGYLHDLCKVNVYKRGYKITKHPVTQEWVSVGCYNFDESEPLGHGEKSTIMASRFINLTLEEELMLRWHMGAFRSHDDIKGFSAACDKCKGVALIHSADFVADHFMEEIVQEEFLDKSVYNKWVAMQSAVEATNK